MSAWGAGGRGFESHRPHLHNGFTYYCGLVQYYYGNLLPKRANLQKECKEPLPAKLTTTVSKIAQVPNKTNSAIIEEFYMYMRAKGSSEQHQNNVLKTIIAYANFLGSETTFLDVQQKSQITAFLDNKVKPPEQDPEGKWITTYNHYLRSINFGKSDPTRSYNA
jgi:hypothetical protein